MMNGRHRKEADEFYSNLDLGCLVFGVLVAVVLSWLWPYLR